MTAAWVLPGAAVSHVVAGPLAAGVTAATGLLLAGCISVRLCQWNRRAYTDLERLPERGMENARGPLMRLVDVAAEQLGRYHAEARQAIQEKTDLEARFHVRHKRLQRAEAALQALEAPMLMTDSGGELLFANKKAELLLAEMAGQGQQPQTPDELKQCYASCCELKTLVNDTRSRNAVADRRVSEFAWQHDGQTVNYRATAENLYGTDGALLGVLAVLYDICDVTQMRTRHVEFVSSVSHEMKTPMAGIKAYLEMLMDGDVNDADEVKELYGFIDGQIDRLTRLTDNMLNLARIESGVIKVQRQDCELNGILQRAADVVRPVCDEKQLTMVSELSDLYLPVHVDADLLSQAVINLLSNAVKYSPPGGEVRLRSRMDDQRAVIEVRDTGMGIPPESLQRVFDRFYRVPEHTSAAAGTGLGLSLVRHIISDIHGGQVRVDSRVGEGSCFTIEIPLGHRDRGRKKGTGVLCAAS